MPSLVSASKALTEAGYDSICIANQAYRTNYDGQFDVMLASKIRLVKGFNTPFYLLNVSFHFGVCLFSRDIYHTFFTGGVLGNTPLAITENFLWRCSGGKHIVFPYGQDGFVYSELPNTGWALALKSTYPRTRREDDRFKSRIEYLSKRVDCVVGCIVHTVNLPRVDVWPVLWYPSGISFDYDKVGIKKQGLVVAHATNHRELKGTKAIIAAVDKLKQHGFDIELDLIENVSIKASRSRLANADIVVDQLLMGYAMLAIEGLSLSKPVISGFDESILYEPFYRLSYLKSCPIVTANPETIFAVLEEFCKNPEETTKLGSLGREYVDQYHSDEACTKLFQTIYDKIWFKRDIDLEKLFLN